MRLAKRIESFKVALGHDLYIHSFRKQGLEPPKDVDSRRNFKKYVELVVRVSNLARSACIYNPAINSIRHKKTYHSYCR